MTEKSISRVHVNVSPGSAETIVRRSGITNHHLIAYSLSNISAKNYLNELMCVEVIQCVIAVSFVSETPCRLRTVEYQDHRTKVKESQQHKGQAIVGFTRLWLVCRRLTVTGNVVVLMQ